MDAPSGPYQCLKCSGSVHIFQTRSTGASKSRSITTASCGDASVIAVALSLRLELREVVVHLVEARFPHAPVLLSPGRHLFEWCGVKRAWAVLGALAAHDETGLFQNLDVFRHGGERQCEGLGELVHGRGSQREPSEDR